MTEKTIDLLIVEDEKGWREVVCKLKEEYNLNLDIVNGAEIARAKMTERTYDALLVDVGEASFKKRMSLNPVGYSFVDWVMEEYPNIWIIGYGAIIEDVEANHFHRLIDKCDYNHRLSEEIVQALNDGGFKVERKS